jgi:creatinine amidohydrolase
LDVIELDKQALPAPETSFTALAFSVDTAVEEHGPHLPLATDTIQSYSVLEPLAAEFAEIEICRPLDYGQLTWGLPFGYSIDLTAGLLSSYLAAYVRALVRWKQPRAIYVVDVHGSIAHRDAIVSGLKQSGFAEWAFRWLHEPLARFASERGDQHAGGVETVLVQRVSPQLIDDRLWPDRIDEIAAGQMSFQKAVQLAPDLNALIRYVDQHSVNGVIGEIRNYHTLDADQLFQLMMSVARSDVDQLLRGKATQTSGEDLW